VGWEEKPNMDSVELLEKSEPDVVGRDDDVPAMELKGDDMLKVEEASADWWTTVECWAISEGEYMHE
jgi:hypothetical protein